MEKLKLQELQEFYEMVNELKEKKGKIKSVEQEKVQRLIEKFEGLYSRETKLQKVIPVIANLSLSVVIFIAIASAVISGVNVFSGVIIVALVAGVISLVGFGVKLKADNDLLKTKAKLQNKLHQISQTAIDEEG